MNQVLALQQLAADPSDGDARFPSTISVHNCTTNDA
jgi:hypothetical protein